MLTKKNFFKTVAKKIAKNNFLFLSIFVFILSIELLILFPKINKNLDFSHRLNIESTEIEKITNEGQLSEIYSKNDNLSAIKLIFTTYKKDFGRFGEKTSAILEFNLYDENKQLVRAKEIQIKKIKDNQEHVIRFHRLKDSGYKKYSFELKLKNITDEKENLIGVYKKNGNISLDLGYKSFLERIILFSVIGVILLFNILIVFFLYKRKNIKKEKIFLILTVIYEIFILFLNPPFTGNDEEFHFIKSYAISTG